jgi:outer membrane protein
MILKRISLLVLIALSAINTSNADNLLQIYQTAKLKDPIILKSKAQYDLAVEKITAANAALLPQIGFGLNSTYTKESENLLTNSNYGADLSLNQSIYNGAYWQQLDIAEKQATQFAASYGFAAQELLLRTASTYFEVLRADQAVKSVQANKRAVERQLKQTKQRFQVGLIAITAVHEAQAEYDRTTADEINAQNTLINSYYILRELTGNEVHNIAYLNNDTFAAQKLAGNVQYWRNTSIEKNLNLHNKRISKEIAKMQIELAAIGHLPSLGLVAGLGYNNTDYDIDQPVSRNTDSSNATIGLNFNVPLYSGGKITSVVKQAQFNYVFASEDLIQAFRSIDSQVSRNYNNVRASMSSIQAYQQTLVSSKSALRATQAGFEVGTRTVVDVLNSTRSLYESENQLANARYDYIINMLQLKFSAGTLSEQDIRDVSAGLVDK